MVVRCVAHRRFIDYFDGGDDVWSSLLWTNAGSIGPDDAVNDAIARGLPWETIRRRHLVERFGREVSRHRGCVERTAAGWRLACPRCEHPPFHFREPVFSRVFNDLAAQGLAEVDLHLLVSLYRAASRFQ